MTKAKAKTKATAAQLAEHKTGETHINLTRSLSRKSKYVSFSFWLIGETPLITHAWSEKARRQMLEKQVKATKGGKEVRDPYEDFRSAIYEMGDGRYGFPLMGIKNSIASAAHKDKGIVREALKAALWLNAEMVRVRPALAGAICDMPLTQIYGSQPEMREDMVKIGSGLNKIANLAYRPQFTHWAMKIDGRFNASTITADSLGFLIEEAGMSAGLGEWRNERKGVFGAYRLANEEEELQWEAYRTGKGPMPLPAPMLMAAE